MPLSPHPLPGFPRGEEEEAGGPPPSPPPRPSCSLVRFLTGNLWEALKDDSLAGEPLGLISGPPTAAQADFLAPCPVDASPAGDQLHQHHSLPGVQLTTLYSAFLDLDPSPAPAYLNPPGSKPIALV